MTAWTGFPDPDDGTDGVRCECGRFVPCRHCVSPAQSRLERDLSDFHGVRVSEHPPPEIVALAARTVREAARRAAERIEEAS